MVKEESFNGLIFGESADGGFDSSERIFLNYSVEKNGIKRIYSPKCKLQKEKTENRTSNSTFMDDQRYFPRNTNIYG